MLYPTGVIIGLKKNIRELETVVKQLKTKVERLEKVLCPECKKKLVEVFREKN